MKNEFNPGWLKFRVSKGWQLLPSLITRPSRIPWLVQGVTPGRLISLDVGWIRNAGIRTVLDIGANVGQFAAAVQHLLPDATIHSFEPLPDCYASMVKRMEGNEKFHGYAVAVGDEDSSINFLRNDFSQSSSVLPMANLHKEVFSWSSSASQIQVPVRRLDSLMDKESFDAKILIKIDVQGYEDRVLAGGELTIRSADIVMIETSVTPLYEGQASFEMVYETMSRWGFRYGGNTDQFVSPLDGRILQVDALFLRN